MRVHARACGCFPTLTQTKSIFPRCISPNGKYFQKVRQLRRILVMTGVRSFSVKLSIPVLCFLNDQMSAAALSALQILFGAVYAAAQNGSPGVFRSEGGSQNRKSRTFCFAGTFLSV